MLIETNEVCLYVVCFAMQKKTHFFLFVPLVVYITPTIKLPVHL